MKRVAFLADLACSSGSLPALSAPMSRAACCFKTSAASIEMRNNSLLGCAKGSPI
jgi:hypothetical protein